MSETTTPVAPAVAAAPAEAPAPAAPAPPTPSPSSEATGAEPATVGVTPPEAGGESPAPAASSEPAAETAEQSILSAATEAKPEATEAPAETPKADAPAEVPAAPAYEFKAPEGFTLDPTKVGSFTSVLADAETRIAADPKQAHTILQEFGQKLVELHTAEVKEAAERYTQLQVEGWKRTNEDWQAEFRDDPEIGKNRQETTLLRLGSLMDMYAREAGVERREALGKVLGDKMTGAGNNIEVLRWANWIARKLTETSRVVVPMMPRAPQQTGSKAERLYKNSLNGAA